MPVSVSGDNSLEWNASLNIEDFQGKLNEIEANLKSNFDKEAQRDLLRQKAQTEYAQTITSSAEAFSLLDDKVKVQIADLIDLRSELAKIKDAQANIGQGVSLGKINNNDATALLAGLFVKEKQLEAAINDTNTAINKQIKSGSAGFNELGEGAQNAVEPTQRISARIREITNELIGLDKGSARFNALITEAAQLTDELGDARAQIKLLSSDTSHLDAGLEAIQGLAGAFAAAQGAMALFGEDNKELEKSLLKVNAAMSVLQGLQQIGQVLDKNSALNIFLLKSLRQEDAAATQLEAAANVELAAAEGEAIVATEGLTAAMEANPAGILLLAISALFIAYQTLSSSTKDAEEEQKAMNDALAEAGKVLNDLVASFNQLNKDRTQAAEDALKLAQSEGKSTNEILQLQLKIADAKKYEQTVALTTLGYDKQRLAEANAQLENLQQQELSLLYLKAQTGELSKFDQQRLEKLQAQEKALRATLDPANAANAAIKAADQEAANIRAEQARKAHEDALKSSQAEADTRLLAAKKNSKEELDARIADIRTAARVELDNVNLTSGERKKVLAQEQKDIADANRAFAVLQLNNQKSLLNAQLADVEIGSAKELGLRIDLLNKSAEIEQAADGVTAQKKKEISAKLAKDVSDLTKKYALDNQKVDLDTAIAGINTRLSAVEKGGEQELALNKQLIDAKASADIVSAQQQITNQTLLVARIKEINAKARHDEKKADDDYFDNRLQEQLKSIDNSLALQNIPLQAVENDPLATYKEKYDAQRRILVNDLSAVQEQINLTGNNIIKSQGDAKNLKVQLDALEIKKAQIQSDLDGLNAKHSEDTLKAFAKYAHAAADAFGTIGDAVSGFNQGLADTLGTMSEIATQAANVAAAIASHDPVAIAAAGINAVSSIIKIFSASKESERKANEELIAYQQRVIDGEIHVNELYRERLRQQVEINKLKVQGIRDESDLLKKQQAENLADYNRILSLVQQQSKITGEHTEGYGGVLGIGRKTRVVQDLGSLAGSSYDDLERLFNSGALTEKAKALFEELQKLKQEGVDIDAALEENKAKAAELFTGTTSDSILDSIVQGFQDGKRATADFADNFQDLMKNAILNSLKYQALEKPLKDFYDQFAAFSESDSQLTQSEIDNLQTMYNSIITNAGKQFDDLQKLTNVNFESNSSGGNSLTGAIKGISAEQAQLLAGQFGGMRLTAIEQLNVAQSSLIVQGKIEANTAAAATTLATYYRKWDTVGGLKVQLT